MPSAVAIGIAKPPEALGQEEPAVSTPTTSPPAVVSAPPESPEMSAALVDSMPRSVSAVPLNWSDAVTDLPAR